MSMRLWGQPGEAPAARHGDWLLQTCPVIAGLHGPGAVAQLKQLPANYNASSHNDSVKTYYSFLIEMIL